MMYVLDGGALLHCVRWKKNMTYLDLANEYIAHIRKDMEITQSLYLTDTAKGCLPKTTNIEGGLPKERL